jgi:peptidoglycan-associated lipoprotein
LAPILDLRVEPEQIRRGESALLTWRSEHADGVEIDPAIGPVDLSGRIKFFPDETTTYTVSARGAGGSTAKSVTVEVLGSDSGTTGGVLSEDLENTSLDERFNLFVKPVFFAFDSTELTSEARLTLDGNLRWLEQVENRMVRFVLEGHADERGSEEYNLALGDKRAQVVKEYLLSKGLDASRVETVSLGEERPFASGTTEEAYAMNRRTQFLLLNR